MISSKPFRINTCKSVSKQTTSSVFRINTYEKQGVGGLIVNQIPRAGICPERAQRVEGTLFVSRRDPRRSRRRGTSAHCTDTVVVPLEDV
jgi:hypothetical protein